MLHYQISFTNKVCDTHDAEIHDAADCGETAHVVEAGGVDPNGDDDAGAVAAEVVADHEHDGDVVHVEVESMHQSGMLKLNNTITPN